MTLEKYEGTRKEKSPGRQQRSVFVRCVQEKFAIHGDTEYELFTEIGLKLRTVGKSKRGRSAREGNFNSK